MAEPLPVVKHEYERTEVACVEYFTYERLKQINRALFGDGTPLTPDARRDLAESMRLALEAVVFVPEDKLK